jgi:hypothetical protein
MNHFETAEAFHFYSDNLAVALAKTEPRLLYLGLESGGRKRTHRDNNLLRPGSGGGLFPGRRAEGAMGVFSRSNPQEIAYNGLKLPDGTNVTCEISVLAREVRIRIEASSDLTGEVFRIAFAPDVAPPSLWASPKDWNRRRHDDGATSMVPETKTREYLLPATVSFPDYGMLSLTAGDGAVTVVQQVVPDLANAGLNLGLPNVSDHIARKAYHLGEIALVFVLGEPRRSFELVLTVLPELVPEIEGCDFTGDQWQGFRRCWMNAFTLNQDTLSLGDNPILHGLGHLAIHWKSDMAVYTPELSPGLKVQDFFRNALDLTFTEHTDSHGKMTGYGWENGACNLIALHAYLLVTGDWEFARKHQAIVERIVEYNLSLDSDGDGILEALYHGNHFRDEKTSLNWWDAFAFGHKDAYGNLVYYQAFRRIREVLDALGSRDCVDRIDAFLSLFRANFHSVFYNEATGVYSGWISRDGKMHDYMFTFITAMAINEGLVGGAQAREMLIRLLGALDESGYGEFRYGVPGPAVPVHPDDRSDWGPMADWGRYENGGFCGQTAYHFILALYRTNMREEADRILFNLLDTFEELPTHSGLNPGFCKSWDWRTRDGQPCGYNYLADNYVFLLASIQGHYGVDLPALKSPHRDGGS